ncbi:CHASE2 domain-containing protein [Trichothermofontia sp.]
MASPINPCSPAANYRSNLHANAAMWQTFYANLRARVQAHLSAQLTFWQGLGLVVPAITGGILVLRGLGLLQMLEWAALDQLFRLRPRDAIDPRIAIVMIDEATIRREGWPISDATLATVLDRIRQQQPRVIGLDLYRDLPVEPGHRQLAAILRSTPNLIGVAKVVSDTEGPAVNAPPILKAQQQVAAADVVVDADGKVRRGLLALTSPAGEWVEGLATALVLRYLAVEGVELTVLDPDREHYQLGQAKLRPFRANDGGYVRADDGGYQLLINFRGGIDRFVRVSMTAILMNQVPPHWAHDRVVLIGTTADSVKDFFLTPYSSTLSQFPEPMPGVVLHANIASQLLSAALAGRPLLRVWPPGAEWGWITAWASIGAILGWQLRSQKLAQPFPSGYTLLLGLAIGTLTLAGTAYVAFLWGWWIPTVPPLLALGGATVVMTGYVARLERADRQTMMQLFGRHVTPKIAEVIWLSRYQLLHNGQLVGHKLTATVLFSDLRGFSTLAEHMDPAALMVWLNEYMQAMAQIVLDHDGVVDKFIGDSVMAVFGVPIRRTSSAAIAADAKQAVTCAVAMAERLRSLNQAWQRSGRPTVSMRIGIATGPVVTGSLGSAQRLDYTTLGDTVNIAARLEAYDKTFGVGLCRILISETTYQYIQGHFATTCIGKVQLRGREQPLQVYQVLLEPLSD